jgi:hypothetical protein
MWTNAANWSLGVQPNSSHDVVIRQTGANTVILNAAVEVASLDLGQPGGQARLSITNGALLCDGTGLVRTNVWLNLAGALTFGNSAQMDGTLNWADGSLSFSGSTCIGSLGSQIIE